jgi:hypothetical protein|tara:strand:+ start:127 stop:765 length:639 start_codon:yes stop_codon:yes gene_type:complete
MKLITEHTQEVEYITEGKSKQQYIQGIFMQADLKNQNGRIYPHGVLQKEVNNFNTKYVNEGRALGELGHPMGPIINLDRVSHVIKELKEDGKNFIGKAKVMDTPNGKIVKSFISEGVKLGVSSRGMGSVKTNKAGVNEVQSDFVLSTVDIVADPSAPDAFVNGIMEGKEWVWENGVIKEREIDIMKKTIERANMRELEQKKLEVFTKFLQNL